MFSGASWASTIDDRRGVDAVADREAKPGYQVRVTTAAGRDLKRLKKELDRQKLARIDEAIRRLGDDPRPHGCEPVENAEGIFRIRVVDHRILYGIDVEQRLVRIARIRHRRDVYRH
jgi:mRNA interferase RelE/StbE